MGTPGSRVMTIGLIFMLFFVSTGLRFGGYGLLLCFTGVLFGASLVAAVVRMADGTASNPIVPMVSRGARALTAFMRRNTAAVGLVMASCAFTVVSSEEDPVLCFGMFTLLMLGVILKLLQCVPCILNCRSYWQPDVPWPLTLSPVTVANS